MDTAQWPQEVGMVKPMEEMVPSTTCSRPPPLVERKTRPQKDQALNCPRCNSINTKFCYYNNYSLTQPRYFCKTCRRYWTEGGSLRNVPIGGGSRKNKRSSSSSSSSKKATLADLNPPAITPQNPKINEGHDLNLAFQTPQDYHHMPQLDFVELPNIDNSSSNNNNNGSSSSNTTASLPALELLRSTGIASRGLSSFMPMPMAVPDSNSVYPSGFGLNFPFDHGTGSGGAYVNSMGGQESGNGRLLFPFEDLKPVSGNDFDQNRGQAGDSSSGYWNGMLGGGSW